MSCDLCLCNLRETLCKIVQCICLKCLYNLYFEQCAEKGGNLVGPCGFKAAQCVLCEISSKSILHNVCRCTMCRAICVCCIVLQFAIVQFYNVQRLCANVRNVYFIILCTMCKVYFARSVRDPLQECARYIFKTLLQSVF